MPWRAFALKTGIASPKMHRLLMAAEKSRKIDPKCQAGGDSLAHDERWI
jgi:hypothetical protein